MCLITHRAVHQFTDGQTLSSLETRRPILVWKALIFKKTMGLVSPYQLTPYEFGKLYDADMATIAALEEGEHPAQTEHQKLFSIKWPGFVKHRTREDVKLTRGIHSCTVRWKAETHGHPFPAIIPVGSKVWFGNNEDIVSDRLIVYKHPEDLLAVHGSVTEPKPWKELVHLS